MLSLYAVLVLGQESLSIADEIKTIRVRYSKGASSQGAFNLAEAVAWADRLRRLTSYPEDKLDRNRDNSLSVDPRFVAFHYKSRIHSHYRISDGKLFAWGFREPETRAPSVSFDDCIAKAKEWYFAAGQTEPIVLNRAFFEPRVNEQEVHVVFQFVAPGTNYRFANGMEAIIDRTYGTPNYMWLSQRPAFEAARRVVNREVATANAAAAAFQLVKWEVLEAASQDAAYVIPNYSGMPNRMSSSHVRRVSEKKACLMYEVTVHDASALKEEGKMRPFVQVYVDAESGEPIAIFPAHKRMGGASFTRTPFKWESVKWQVGKVTGKVMSTQSAIPKSGKRVTLRNNRSVVFAQFDRSSGLVWIAQDGKTIVGLPEKGLSKALEAAIESKGFLMNEPPAKN